MKHAVKRSIMFTLAALAVAAADVAAQTRTVVVVRHAEKADDSADPLLSAEGQERAEALIHALHGRRIGAIFTTQFQRTRLTAAPIANALGITPVVVAAAGPNHVEDVVRHVRESDADLVLVVGHSNTVPAIVRALSGEDVGAIADAEYGHIYEVTLAADGTKKVSRGWYGRARPGKD